MVNLTQVGLGILIAATISALALKFKLLCPNGAIAAFLLGAIVFGLGGFPWAIVLMVFFLTSSGLSIIFRRRKITAEEKYAKGSVRDWGQVLANGGLAGLFVVLSLVIPQSPIPWLGFSAALAAANADTWATELGSLSRKNPVMISTFKQVQKGTSGGVSMFGLAASLAGSLVIAAAGILLEPEVWSSSPWLFLAIVSIAGFTGSLADSWMGATIQAIFFCPQCGRETEKSPLHSCGTETRLVRGKRWMTNDLVNFFCTLKGTGVAIVLYALLMLIN
jgi:uncharacterized protein (TIGR00297 family)